MVTNVSFRIRSFGKEVVPPRQFDHFVRRLGCFEYSPVRALNEAFSHYGILKVYIDSGSARRILDDQKIIAAFSVNQRVGAELDPNLAASFSHHDVVVVKYDEDTICFIARTANLDLLKAPQLPDIAAVIRDEVARDFPSRRKTTLDDIELGGLLSGPNQGLMVQILLGKVKEPEQPK